MSQGTAQADATPAGDPHFFISRAGPDRDYAVRIAYILETAGYRVVIQDRDIVNESFMAAMHGALSSGARTIALLSNDYMDPKRVHCAAEWQATITSDPSNTRRRLIVFRVGECVPVGLLQPLAYWDLVRVRDETLLADIVLGAVSPDAGTALPEAVAQFWREGRPIVHHQIYETLNFTGRGDAIADIDNALTSGETAAITQSRVAVRGMGGIGKSTLARQYAYEASAAGLFAGIWWLNAARDKGSGGYDGIESALLELRDTLYPGTEPPRERAPAARGMLDFIANGGFAKPWLLVYDNVDDMRALEAWKPPRNAHVLITTRITTFRKGEVTPIAIEEWALPDAVDYLLRESGRDDLTRTDAEAVAEKLGRLPLALSHAAAYLREVPTATAASYLAAIERRMRSVPPSMADAKSVYATFQEAIAQAEAQAAGATQIITFAALLAPDNIPVELLAQDAKLYPPELAAVLTDPDGLEATTGALARLSLIEQDREARTFSVHRLVQEAALDRLLSDDRKSWQSAGVAVCGAAHPGYDHTRWPAFERLLAHTRVVAWAADDDIGASLGDLFGQIGRYYYDRAAYAEAAPAMQRSLDIREKALGPDHPDVGTSLNNLAGLYEAQGKYDLAEPLYKRTITILEKALGPDHPSVGTSLNNLAGLYEAQGKYDLAEPLYKRTITILEKALGPDHPSVGTSLNNLAILLANTDRLDEAAPLATRALAICERALGTAHTRTRTVAQTVAGIEAMRARRE